MISTHQEYQESNVALPKIAILLCTYNGQLYLAAQLDSYETQSYTNWKVWASDDYSQDSTRAILENYLSNWGADRISFQYGPKKGFVTNFLSLTCDANIQADYYAYSDQDDIWEADKLQRAVDWLLTSPKDVPALYCTATRLINEKNQGIGLSSPVNKPPGFANALIQSLAGGNTMVFNNAARKLIIEAGAEIDVIYHDWWIYMVISGCGGKVFYDAYPSVRYRQHSMNLVGLDPGWTERFVRAGRLFQGFYRKRNDRNIEAIQKAHLKLTPENQEIYNRFVTARKRWLLPRLIGIRRSGVYCQTLYANLSLIVAAIFKEI
jgi:glycosyltransferase involved in cell wall biosynthesis